MQFRQRRFKFLEWEMLQNLAAGYDIVGCIKAWCLGYGTDDCRKQVGIDVKRINLYADILKIMCDEAGTDAHLQAIFGACFANLVNLMPVCGEAPLSVIVIMKVCIAGEVLCVHLDLRGARISRIICSVT